MPLPMSVDDFLRALTAGIVQQLGPLIAQQIQTAPPKVYEVNRMAVDGGQRKEQITLPQVMADVADQLRINNALTQQQNNELRRLCETTSANAKVLRKMLRRADDDDDE